MIRNSLEEPDIVGTVIDQNNLIIAGKSLNPWSNSRSQAFLWRPDDSTMSTKDVVVTDKNEYLLVNTGNLKLQYK
jgi:hypothetical protein